MHAWFQLITAAVRIAKRQLSSTALSICDKLITIVSTQGVSNAYRPRVKWFSLEKGFGFIASDEGEDVYLAATALPEGVTTVKPGTKLEFSVIDSRKGPQAMSIHIIDAPVSLAENSRVNNDDLAAMIEDTIKILDKVGNGLRQGRHPSGAEAERLGRVLRGIAGELEA